MVAAWFECYQSVVIVQRKFWEKFGKNTKLPYLIESGEVEERPSPDRTVESIGHVSDHFTAGPTTSKRLDRVAFDLSKSTIHRILRQNLQLRPFKIRVLKEFSEEDFAERLTF